MVGDFFMLSNVNTIMIEKVYSLESNADFCQHKDKTIKQLLSSKDPEHFNILIQAIKDKTLQFNTEVFYLIHLNMKDSLNLEFHTIRLTLDALNKGRDKKNSAEMLGITARCLENYIKQWEIKKVKLSATNYIYKIVSNKK